MRRISLGIIFFFGLCLAQQWGDREDWPFSFFGMYRGTVGNSFERFDLEYIPPGGEAFNLYRYENGYYLMDRFNAVLRGERLAHNNEVLVPAGELRTDTAVPADVHRLFLEDVVPILTRRGFDDPNASVRLRFRRWVEFSVERRTPPVQDVVVYAAKVSELREAAP